MRVLLSISEAGGVSYKSNDTPSVFACGESTSLRGGGKGVTTDYLLNNISLPTQLFAQK